ncbi:hypothetical protein DV738_g5678, partial [Chaetothyriales sp. CBS 135597]
MSLAAVKTVLRPRKPQKQQQLLVVEVKQPLHLKDDASIPASNTDHEVLVRIEYVGLNPIDWKSVTFGWGLPSLPCIVGRDYVGRVVHKHSPDADIGVEIGDVVLGISTDYRDYRKAAFQQYAIASSFNLCRIPPQLYQSHGVLPSIGVAFVSAALSLGVCIGLDFSKSAGDSQGPDLFSIVRSLDRTSISEDIRQECFDSITESERIRPGDWIAIWGASSTVGFIALQLAKRAGLRVVCVANVVKHGAFLLDAGADALVNKNDPEAVEAVRGITQGKRLRYGFDAVGKETAQQLQATFAADETSSHLVCLVATPKETVEHVRYHKLPMKLFHESREVGRALMLWLEELLSHHDNGLILPKTDLHSSTGLQAVNAALDRLRHGHYWVPNVSGGLVISKIEQRTKWDLESNVKYARTAEDVGFEYALSQIRFLAGYGAEFQHEPVTFSTALLLQTKKLHLIVALLPGPWNPAVAAKQIASIDHYSNGRVAVNVVSGWFKSEFLAIGQWWLDHSERYRRSREFIQCLKGIWTQDKFSFSGDFYQFHDYPLNPKPLKIEGRPHPEIFQGGNSIDARENAATVSDYYFMNGNTLEGFQTQIADVKQRARREGREDQVKFALNAFVIARDTEAEAIQVLAEIQGKADKEAVEAFGDEVKNAGASTANKTGMWANSKFEDLVQYNDGFKTKLIGTPAQIADRILLLKSLGVSVLLTAFLHYDEEIEQFGKQVLPLVRKLEAEGRGTDQEYEIKLTGDK